MPCADHEPGGADLVFVCAVHLSALRVWPGPWPNLLPLEFFPGSDFGFTNALSLCYYSLKLFLFVFSVFINKILQNGKTGMWSF